MLESLQRRPRTRSLVRLKRRLTGRAKLDDQIALAQARAAALAPLAAIPERREYELPRPRPGAATRRFADALGDWQPDLAIEDPPIRVHWDRTNEDDRLFLRIQLAVWQDAPGFCERTGLRRDEPPWDVHAMARGPLAAGGGLNAADLVADSLAAAGTPLEAIAPARALDFGGSSGRVVRVLQAAWPEFEWHSCDPNADAVAWGAEHLPGIGFHRSEQEPPLPFEDAAFGLVYAISVWSHLSEAAARRWFAEMHRILAPGGLLVPTVQSLQTTRHLAELGLWELVDISEAIADMYTDGYHFRRTFGPDGDHGVAGADWGFATMSAEWLLRTLTPDWEVLLWRSGAHERDQDVVVLRRR